MLSLGDAAKGFAPVPSEVKALANQTAKATEDISEQIAEINSVTARIASAIEEQNVATQEVNQNTTMVSDASVETEGMAKDVMQEQSELSQQAEMLQTHIISFLQTNRRRQVARSEHREHKGKSPPGDYPAGFSLFLRSGERAFARRSGRAPPRKPDPE